MAKTGYMHTLDGCPADFIDGHIVFSHLRIKLWPSLVAIRKNEKLNDEWTKSRDYLKNDKPLRLGYVTVRAVDSRAAPK